MIQISKTAASETIHLPDTRSAKLKVIIIDDEVHARNILAHYLNQWGNAELVGQYDNCISCFEAHDLDNVDLLLLDINLPSVSGIQFSRTIARYKVEVIFTTAYQEYALEGYEHNIVDYLLKPIEFDRFAKAMQKVQHLVNLKKSYEKNQTVTARSVTPSVIAKNGFIFIKADYKIIKVNLDEITFIEGLQEYVRIHLVQGKPIITLQSLKNLIDILPTAQFFRIHRSYIININRLEYIQQRNLVVGGKELRVGKNYWDDFFAYLNNNGIF
jgi:DNA-binding LytR/AlgR family response regulator